jgi:hypothetical protein
MKAYTGSQTQDNFYRSKAKTPQLSACGSMPIHACGMVVAVAGAAWILTEGYCCHNHLHTQQLHDVLAENAAGLGTSI